MMLTTAQEHPLPMPLLWLQEPLQLVIPMLPMVPLLLLLASVLALVMVLAHKENTTIAEEVEMPAGQTMTLLVLDMEIQEGDIHLPLMALDFRRVMEPATAIPRATVMEAATLGETLDGILDGILAAVAMAIATRDLDRPMVEIAMDRHRSMEVVDMAEIQMNPRFRRAQIPCTSAAWEQICQRRTCQRSWMNCSHPLDASRLTREQ
ncbi:hypothetical protein BC939DRAFT_448861 [Gamsiella multidivaricata]|uniref:uncharacterized protein n=1 Tax=Gamsiella multidivaricata TaxID=101098 RepID=UPI00221F34A9|nr:uncharacterized protein BC939DRAFT_448861 [Gamsiella multidivaricata]KAI7825147.1 hypothetical protein BC939DRAFT_448861 [Gamsiella multidivaricata]